MNFHDFRPHREETPARNCDSCGAWLSTGNQTKQCWPCGKSWTNEFQDTQLGRLIHVEFGDAWDRVMAA